MSWKYHFLIFSTLLCCSGHALIEQTIDEKKPVPVVLSKTSHNRIAVQEGGVDRVFAAEAYFNISIDRTTGNAFVTVIREIPEAITLTVVTNSGLIQDLSVTAADKPSEHLILKEEGDDEGVGEKPALFHEHTVGFLNQILEGHVPLGYGQRELTQKDALELPKPLIVFPVKAFEGAFEEVVVYTIKNGGKDPIILNAESLKKRGASWVFLNAHELKAKEGVVCLISTPKSEG